MSYGFTWPFCCYDKVPKQLVYETCVKCRNKGINDITIKCLDISFDNKRYDDKNSIEKIVGGKLLLKCNRKHDFCYFDSYENCVEIKEKLDKI